MSRTPARSRPAVVVLGDVGGACFHVGDEAMLDANVELVRGAVPGASVTVLGRHATPADLGRALDGADAALIAGGGGLALGWPALAEQRLAFVAEATRRAIPVAAGGQTLVPALGDAFRARLAAGLAGLAQLGTRELPSTALALELGVPAERIAYQADDAYGLAGRPPGDAALLAAAAAPYVAVTLDGSYAPPAMLPALRSLAAQLAALATAHGLAVVFVPHYGELGAAAGPDADAGHRLAELLRLAGARCHVAPVLPVAEAVWLARHAALTVSSRYHPLVFATAAARPCVGLYRDAFTFAKVQGALVHAGAERWCLETRAAEGGALAVALRGLWAGRDAVAARMAEARAEVEEREAGRRRALLERLGLLGAPAARRTGTMPRVPAPERTITDEQWDAFHRDGYLPLGPLLDADDVARLAQHADDLALGRVANDHVQLQIDTGGAYEELPEAVPPSTGPGSTARSRGSSSTRSSPRSIRHPRCFEVCAELYGPHVPLSIFRAMVMNKPAGQGTHLPWHQDGGDVWALDREPLVTIWVALDAATTANGCMDAVRGSHRLGLLTAYGSTLSDADAAAHCPPDRVVQLEVPAGHAVLMHNWLIHRSGVNPSPDPRRAVTICYLDGRTRSVLTGDHFPVVHGEVDTGPHHYVRELREHAGNLERSFAEAEKYALSLKAHLDAAQAALAAPPEHRDEGRWRRAARARLSR